MTWGKVKPPAEKVNVLVLTSPSKMPPRSIRPPIPWEQARQHAIIQASEMFHFAHTHEQPLPPRLHFAPPSSRSFAWNSRTEANAIAYVLVDGDPGCVYPGITSDILMNDACAINKFFPESCAAQMAAYVRDILDGKQSDPFELVWRSAPDAEFDLCVAVTVEEVLRYTNSNDKTTCLLVGHTTDLTSLIRAHEAQLVSVQHQTEQKLIDHRIANMVHTASLFVQDQKPEEAIAQLGHIRSLIDVCRGRRELLSTTPVVLRALLGRAFLRGSVCEQGEQTVQFLVKNELLPPDLLCYRILDIIASICYEYGNASPVRLQVQLAAAIDATLMRVSIGD